MGLKRIFLFLLAAMLLFTACQKTPEAEIVVQKDSDRMIEQALITPENAAPDLTLREQYGIPDTLSFTDTGADGKLTITVDAEVVAPEKPLPIVRVEAAQFDQETVSGFWRATVGDKPMVEQVFIQTKADIQKQILYFKQVQAGIIDGLYTPEEAQAEIDDLEKSYPGAPESIEPVPATDELKLMTDTFGSATLHYYGIMAQSEDKDNKLFFDVRNDGDNEEAITVIDYDEDGNETGSTTALLSRNAWMSCSWRISGGHCNFSDDTVMLKRTDSIPDYAAGMLSLTPEQAASRVEDFLQKAGLSHTMGIFSIYLMSDKNPRNGVPEPTAYGYRICCTRLVGGVPVTYQYNVQNSGGYNGNNEQFAPQWGYENMIFDLEDEGMSHAIWQAPMRLLDTVTEQSQLKPFSEIEEIARKMLRIKYEPDARDEHTESIRIDIDRVELSLQRVAEQDNFERGLLIPAWNFFGKYSYTFDDGNITNTEIGSFLSINAIDGSIIDVQQGY